jgi:hypothetical protein
MMETILHILSKDQGEKPAKKRRSDEGKHAGENHSVSRSREGNGTKGASGQPKPAVD